MRNIRPLGDKIPQIHESAYIDPAAVVIGDVVIGAETSVWPGVVVRGDVHRIRIGERSNLQDGVICHCTSPKGDHPGYPLVIGSGVTVGHGAILHACEVGDDVLVGMRATIMDDAVVGSGALIGAGSLVPPGKQVEGGYLWLGSPVRKIRPVDDDERADIIDNAVHYVRMAQRHRNEIDPVSTANAASMQSYS